MHMRKPGPVKRQSFRHEKGGRDAGAPSSSPSESEMAMETLSSESYARSSYSSCEAEAPPPPPERRLSARSRDAMGKMRAALASG